MKSQKKDENIQKTDLKYYFKVLINNNVTWKNMLLQKLLVQNNMIFSIQSPKKHMIRKIQLNIQTKIKHYHKHKKS